jgi:hypothetical protein
MIRLHYVFVLWLVAVVRNYSKNTHFLRSIVVYNIRSVVHGDMLHLSTVIYGFVNLLLNFSVFIYIR